jgi:transposase
MAQNFIESRRDQGYLLPPDVRDWLPADHLAWFVIDAVAEMDLAVLYEAYRADGHGRAAYEPSMMVTLLMYTYATEVRSSRAIEGHCRQDVADRVITATWCLITRRSRGSLIVTRWLWPGCSARC